MSQLTTLVLWHRHVGSEMLGYAAEVLLTQPPFVSGTRLAFRAIEASFCNGRLGLHCRLLVHDLPERSGRALEDGGGGRFAFDFYRNARDWRG